MKRRVEREVEEWTVEKLHKERAQVSFPEYQRQPSLWSTEKKSLLIDSILQDIDIPKLYFNQTRDGHYEVVDGQQRLWAVWEFLDGEYPYTDHGPARRFSDLTPAQQDTIKDYEMQITVLQDADDDYLRELFLRLQLGLLLITGEKLNAAAGAMREFVFRKLAVHALLKSVGIPEKRFARETVAAQICINSFVRGKVGVFSRTRYEDLLQFFKEYERPQGPALSFFQQHSKHISSVMDRLWACLGERSKQLKNRAYLLSVYLFFEELIGLGQLGNQKEQKQFAIFVFDLWSRLREEIAAGMDRKNKELYVFETLISSAPGEKYQIERRHEKLREYYDHYKHSGKIKGDK
jgi:hypothetical protein